MTNDVPWDSIFLSCRGQKNLSWAQGQSWGSQDPHENMGLIHQVPREMNPQQVSVNLTQEITVGVPPPTLPSRDRVLRLVNKVGTRRAGRLAPGPVGVKEASSPSGQGARHLPPPSTQMRTIQSILEAQPGRQGSNVVAPGCQARRHMDTPAS